MALYNDCYTNFIRKITSMTFQLKNCQHYDKSLMKNGIQSGLVFKKVFFSVNQYSGTFCLPLANIMVHFVLR